MERVLRVIGPPYMRGPDVLKVQRIVGVRKPDGAYGPLTAAAVKTWQAKHGLTADGVVGAKTWAKLTAAKPKPPVPAPPVDAAAARLFADLSGYNEKVDLAAYKRAGHKIIWLKLTEGADFLSSTGVARWREAGQLGLTRVAYHFARPSANAAATEAAWFAHQIRAAGWLAGVDAYELDWEDPHFEGAAPARATAWARDWAIDAKGLLHVAPCALYSYGPYAEGTLHEIPAPFGGYHHAAYNAHPEANVPQFAKSLLTAVQFTNGIDGAQPHWLDGAGELGGSKHCDVNRLVVPAKSYLRGLR
jgi:hypothetical protein